MTSAESTRLLEMIKYSGLTKKEFAVKIGISFQTIYKICDGDRNFTLNILKKIGNVYPIEYAWFLSGQGNMLKEDYFESKFKSIKKYPETLPERMETLLNVFGLNKRQFSIRFNVPYNIVYTVILGDVKKISKKSLEKLSKNLSFVPEDYFKI